MAKSRGDLAVKSAPTLAKPSRPRLFDTIPRERLFARLDEQQAPPVARNPQPEMEE